MEDNADFATAEGTHLRFGFCAEVFPLEKESAAGGAAFQVKEAENSQRDSALAGTALADEAENFARLDRERDVAQDSGIIAIVDGEVERE